MSLTLDLSGKVVVICGAGGGGIGEATSLLAAEAGASIVAIDRSQELVDEICGLVEAKGAKVLGMMVDLRDREQTSTIIPAAVKHFGRIDAVINVAGGTTDDQWREIERTTNEMMDSVFALNFDYVFQVCRDAAQVMIKQGDGGAMVNVASVSGYASAPYHALYGAAKAGVVAVSKTMAVEWKRYNIRVNALSPGRVLTRRITDRLKNTGQSLPPDDGFGRQLLNSDDLAKPAIFLISDWASGMTAQNVIVDVGVTQNFAVFPSLAGLQGKIYKDPV